MGHTDKYKILLESELLQKEWLAAVVLELTAALRNSNFARNTAAISLGDLLIQRNPEDKTGRPGQIQISVSLDEKQFIDPANIQLKDYHSIGSKTELKEHSRESVMQAIMRDHDN